MTDLIRRLAAWVGFLVLPPGEERVPYPAPVAAPRPIPPLSLPRHRSPYGLDTPLDATAARAVRPYVTAHELREWRRESAPAALGQDMPGPYWIHGLEVA
ncbi:hypothetical protein [Streptomyces griseochromogenes]|uniref:hypothetical protein n=1 Tax=Streptomyces griseochromogenes TaxID=68214 RepID=UPI003789E488